MSSHATALQVNIVHPQNSRLVPKMDSHARRSARMTAKRTGNAPQKTARKNARMTVIPRKNAPTKTIVQRNAQTTALMVYAIRPRNVPKHVMTAVTKTAPVLRPQHALKTAWIPAMKMAHALLSVQLNVQMHAMPAAYVQWNALTTA